MAEHYVKKIFLWTMIASLSIAALIGIVLFLIGDFGEVEARILGTILTLGGSSLAGLMCAILYERNRFKIYAIYGMFLSVATFIIAQLFIWEAISFRDEGMVKILLTLIILTIAAAHSSLLLLIKSDKTHIKASLIATILFSYIVAIQILSLVWFEYDIEGLWWRILGVFGILDALGTIVTPILYKISNLHRVEV